MKKENVGNIVSPQVKKENVGNIVSPQVKKETCREYSIAAMKEK